MDFFKKMKNIKFEKTGFQQNILHNTYVLYVIFFLSFGNFFIEMMTGDMYFVSLYIIIGFLTSFFSKNMIVILSISVIFANILKYGRASTFENFEGHENKEESKNSDKNQNDNEKDEKDDNMDTHDQKEKKEKNREEFIEDDTNDDTNDENYNDKKDNDRHHHRDRNKKKKDSKDGFTDKELEDMDYEKSEKLLENQKLLLKNMKEYKPFLDTIQGIAKNVSGLMKEKNVE
jgi:hypothetical protein